MKQVPLHFITGFLGSGKTTLINSLLRTAGTKKIGLLLNDFGAMCIDENIVNAHDGIQEIGLAGGQIFCACLSGSFVKSILSFASYDLDCILIEASGLAKPHTLFDIVSAIEKKSGKHFIYGSTSCVIDALSFEKLLQSVNAIKEQALTADRFFITKTEKKTDDNVRRITCILQAINTTAPIEVVKNERISWNAFTCVPLADKIKGETKKRYQTWGDFNRPVTGKAVFTQTVTFAEVSQFLTEIAPHILRAKGFVETSDRKILLCEIASGVVSFQKSSLTTCNQSIVLIKKHDLLFVSKHHQKVKISWD